MDEFNDLRKISQEDLELVLCVLSGLDPGNDLLPNIKQELKERYQECDKIVSKYRRYLGKYIRFWDEGVESYCKVDEMTFDRDENELVIRTHLNIQIDATGFDPNDITINSHWPDTDIAISIDPAVIKSNVDIISEAEYNKILNKALYGRIQ